jgi:membrane protein CcdC involved in cytochrome C biogenesis
MLEATNVPLAPIAAAVLGSVAILVWRIRETRRPITTRSIVIPPLGMSTGLSMFVVPAFRVPWTWAFTAFALGAVVLAYPLLASSRLTREGSVVMMQRSKTFIAVILGLAALRLALRNYVGEFLSVQQTAGLLFVLALGMILRWRAWMLFEYRRLIRA